MQLDLVEFEALHSNDLLRNEFFLFLVFYVTALICQSYFDFNPPPWILKMECFYCYLCDFFHTFCEWFSTFIHLISLLNLFSLPGNWFWLLEKNTQPRSKVLLIEHCVPSLSSQWHERFSNTTNLIKRWQYVCWPLVFLHYNLHLSHYAACLVCNKTLHWHSAPKYKFICHNIQ